MQKDYLNNMKKDKYYIAELLKTIENESIKSRIANELFAYDYNARRYKLIYFILTILSVVLPLVSAAICEIDTVHWLLIIFSGIASISGVILAYVRPKEMWIHYRKYAETCKREISRFIIGEDEDLASEKMLLKNLEKIFKNENGEWQELRAKETDSKNSV